MENVYVINKPELNSESGQVDKWVTSDASSCAIAGGGGVKSSKEVPDVEQTMFATKRSRRGTGSTSSRSPT